MAPSKKPKQKGIVPSQIHETDTPSKKLTLREMLGMQGSSGTYIVHGFLEGDYNPDLSGLRGIDTYDQMRKSDAQVRATLDAMELPIRSTEWQIRSGVNEDGETDELCEQIKDFVEEALFRKMEQTWDDHLREVLTMLPFGYCVKEKVYVADEEHIWLQKLAFRKQQTIYKWEQQDGTAGVTQILPTPVKGEDGKMQSWVSIPASKLLLFTFRKEGDNYAGTSVLRSAYRHWYTKDLLYKFDAIRHERQSVGVPFIKLPKSAGEEDKAVARGILQDLRANEQTGVVVPDGWEFGFADLQATNTSDIWKSIEHHSLMIAKNVLAMFMEIVGGDNGSRALSEDQSDFFLLSQEAVAKQIDDVHNRFLIPELVDLNFDVPATSYYPRLTHKKLGSVDYNTISNVLSTMITSGLITVQKEDEEWARKLVDLPALVEHEADAYEIDPETGEEIDPATGMPVEPEVDPITGEPLAPVQELDEEGNPIEEEEVGDDELSALEDELADVDADEDELNTPDEDDEEEGDGDVVADDDEPEGDAPAEGVDEEMEEDIEEEKALAKKGIKPRFFEIGGKRYAFYEGEWLEGSFDLTGFDGEQFTERTHSFRIVSEATKRKISEALKRALPNNPVVQPHYKRGQPIPADIRKKISEGLKKALPGDVERSKAEAKARGARRKMRGLTQRTLTPSKNRGTQAIRKAQTASLKKGGVIAQTRAARLQKAGKAAKPKKKKSTVSDAKKQAVGKVTNVRNPRKPKATRKKVDAIRQELAKAKTPKARAVVKAKVQKLRKKTAVTKAGKALQQNVANRRAVRARRGKAAGMKATEDKDAPDGAKNGNAPHIHKYSSEDQAVYADFAAFCDWKGVIRLQNAVPRDAEDMEPRARPWAFNDIEETSWRPLTFAEKKVNFSSLRKALESAAGRFDGDVEEITKKQKADILAQVKKAVENNDIAKVGEIKAKYSGELSAALTSIQMEMFEAGKKSVAAEIGVKVPPTAREISGALRVQNDKIVEKYITDMEAAASSAVSQTVAKRGGSITSTGTAEAVNAAAEALERAVRQGKGAMHTLSIIGTLNLGRATIFERYPEEVSAMQYSAIIDAVTTDTCLSLDGKVVKAGSAEFYLYSPPRHYNCRSLWVEILRDEEFQPEVTGIPKAIPANPTIDTFEDLKAPVVRGNSAAIKIIQAEIDERKEKMEEYEKTGQYQNRIDSHSARVNALEEALGKVTGQNDGD